jgi:nitroimidazol reductase NimA-like FMN-containing flavoprotein (pyridoxamine 5'-phosphate oxidase superfamily)
MTSNNPTANLDQRFSSPDAIALPWAEARRRLEQAPIFWLTTVRRDGRPHVTPLIGLWQDDAFYFNTGPGEQKWMNLENNRQCLVNTNSGAPRDELDIVLEGQANHVTDEAQLRRVAEAFDKKYDDWQVEVRNGVYTMTRPDHPETENHPVVFELVPAKALGFGRGVGTFNQTRWRF